MEPPGSGSPQETGMGTAELAAAAEECPEVREAMVIDTGAPGRESVRLLFVVLPPDAALDDALRAAIGTRLRTRAPGQRLPDAIYAAPALPHTPDGGKHEAAVRRVFTGTSPENAGDRATVANPETLRYFVDLFNNL